MWEMLGGRAGTAAHREPGRPPSRQQPVPPFIPARSSLPTRFRAFRNHEWEVVERSLSVLQTRDFYWGPLSVREAHARLEMEPVGTYLLRDSAQEDCLFSLSVRIPSGPISLRITFHKGYFWLKHLCSDCVVKLLEMAEEATRTSSLYCKEGLPLVFSTPLRRSQSLPQQQDLLQQSPHAWGAAGLRAEHRAKAAEQEDIIDPPQPWQEGGRMPPRIPLPLHHHPK
ncbi:suppressor of cytokine signaling 1 [Sarcophilus harrisii]|uniref:SH2 domain-containing protein n=1 Tax=Sarcophilus harrisii TaxID=9305 RepID=A0A7N4P875_SARHA|nr:suppressor of cytokine signaling 1 [Sarcophilus harrisii]XP_031794171.1 suppressor of cytokine signaling 1 [Sarcophilus harrisii]